MKPRSIYRPVTVKLWLKIDTRTENLITVTLHSAYASKAFNSFKNVIKFHSFTHNVRLELYHMAGFGRKCFVRKEKESIMSSILLLVGVWGMLPS